MFDWSDVRIFLSVSARGSFTAAAAELHLDQTTVGRRIAALEASLGTKLFRRGREGLALTAAGHEVLAHAKQMDEAALALDRGVRGRDLTPTGTVRLTTVESFGARFLAPRLAGFRQAYPDIDLELIASNQAMSLTRREADVAVRFGRPDQPGLVARRIGAIAYGLYASPAYVKSHPEPATELAAHDVLGYDEELATIPEARWLASRGARRFVARSNSIGFLEGAAAAGAGVAVLPCYLADGRKELVRLLGPEDFVVRELWIVTHEELREQARIRAVTGYVAREVSLAQRALAGEPDARAARHLRR